jgi:hypothetical protein
MTTRTWDAGLRADGLASECDHWARCTAEIGALTEPCCLLSCSVVGRILGCPRQSDQEIDDGI